MYNILKARRESNKQMKTVITDARTVTNGDIDLSVFKKYGELCVYDTTSKDEICSRIFDADILLCNKTIIGKRELDAAKNLRLIALFATGYNNIDIKYAADRGVAVCNAGGYSREAVAQHVFAFILNRASKISQYSSFTAEGGWIKSRFFSAFSLPTSEIYGKTLGIVGYGSIGSAVAKIAKAFGMKVLAYSRTVKNEDGVTFTDLDRLLSLSDYISVHLPLNEETKALFTLEKFKKCKKSAYFINTARGGVVVEGDLREALDTGMIAGAAVDVLTEEPMRRDCALLGAPNISITPHIAWAPIETRERLLGIVCENIESFLAGRPLNKVN